MVDKVDIAIANGTPLDKLQVKLYKKNQREVGINYQYLEEAHGNGMFFYTSCCGNRMYSVENNPMKYHGCLCPKCFWHNKSVTLYLRGTPDGIRVFETEHVIK